MRFRLSRFAVLGLLSLAGCGTEAAASKPAAPAPSAARVSGSPAVLSREAESPIPARNLYALTAALRLKRAAQIPRVVARSSPNYPVGHQDTFWVLGESQNRYFRLRATIRAETPHLYIYVQDGLKVNAARVRSAAEIFERSIYPTDRAHYGTEWNPGVDGDPHITCLVGDLRSPGAAGFYSAEDEYPRIVNPYSNEREMIYINAGATLPGDSFFNQIMSHEFQHMIHWHMHPHDNAWLNEGMSMLAEYLNHYPPTDEPSAYLSLPSTQLNSWSLGDSSMAHYGAAYLYLAYLYDRFGAGFIRDALSDSRYTDFELINHVLRQRHIPLKADALFAQWVVANYVRDRSIDGGVYGYRQIHGTPVAAKTTNGPNFSFHGSVPPYAAQYVVVNHPSAAFTLHFTGPETVRLVSLAASGPVWWSNRGDMSATSMTRTVDLTKVARATLHFQTRYDIEKDYDYAYVEASTDGVGWTALRGTHTTASNPNGGSYGNAYTGSSKGWRDETVSLSPYAGKRIFLRFQYITDDEYNGQGMVLRDLRIPKIGWHDTFSGWQTAGFLPIYRNALTNHWHVQVITYGPGGPLVSSVQVLNGAGSMRVNASGASKVVVVVFSAAPKSTVSSPYTLSAGSG